MNSKLCGYSYTSLTNVTFLAEISSSARQQDLLKSANLDESVTNRIGFVILLLKPIFQDSTISTWIKTICQSLYHIPY